MKSPLWISACPFMLLTAASAAELPRVPASRMVWWNHPELLRSERTATNVTVRPPPFDPGFLWSEAVISWNTSHPEAILVRARPLWKDAAGPWYTMARWSQDTNASPRTSISGQRDSLAHVDTDTLVADEAATGIEVEIAVSTTTLRVPPDLRFGVSVLGKESIAPVPQAYTNAWGRLLTLPIRSQADFPEGIHSWCSPTSLSMILSAWGDRLNRPELLQDVPQVARGVHDPGWPGTGNWSFNAAYAGQHSGISACVVRLAGIRDLERWIAAGIPVATSVSYAQLKGAAKPTSGDGHLVVVSGFTSLGDIQIHDPGVRRDRVVRVIPRSDFGRAWDHSSRTAYLVWNTAGGTPTEGEGRWPAP